MAAKPGLSVKASEPDQVDSYMRKLTHPLAEVVEALRRVILSAHGEIGEEIKWNAPSFFYTGPIRQFNPKEYKRHIIVFNLHRKDCIRLVFPTGARIGDTSGLLEGDYADGRRLAFFSNTADVHAKKVALQQAVRKWLTLLDWE
jgi:hypothetical protein